MFRKLRVRLEAKALKGAMTVPSLNRTAWETGRGKSEYGKGIGSRTRET